MAGAGGTWSKAPNSTCTSVQQSDCALVSIAAEVRTAPSLASVDDVRSIVDRLRGGDRSSGGRSDEVVAMVLAEPTRFAEVFAAIRDRDPVVRKRASDVAEKVTARRPELLDGRQGELLGDLARSPQEEVRWHVVQMIPRVRGHPGPRRPRPGQAR